MKEPVAIITRGNKVVSGAVLKEYATKPKSKQLSLDAFRKQYGRLGLVEPHYRLEQLAQLMEHNTFHSRCVKTKAHDTAGLGWEIKTAEDLEGEASSEQYKSLYVFLSSQWAPLTVSLTRMMTDYESIGNGYLEVIREDYRPEALVAVIKHIPGHTVRLHKSHNKFCQVRGNKKAWFKQVGYEKDVHRGTGEEKELGKIEADARANEILHFASYTSRSDYYGVPDVLPALGAILGTIAARDYNIKFFSNFGIPAYAVYITGDYDLGEPDENGEYALTKQVKKYFNDLQGEPHSTLILGVPSDVGGSVEVKIQPLAVEVKDASFRLYRKDNRDEILSAHGVPPYRAGIAETGSLGGSTAKESTRIYIESVINPRQEMIEQYFDHFILPSMEITDWRFQLKEIDTSREEHDLEVAGMLFDKGSMKPNDLIRFFGKRFGLEPDEKNEALEAYYIVGQRIDGEPEAITAVQSLHERLVEIARKDAGEKTGA